MRDMFHRDLVQYGGEIPDFQVQPNHDSFNVDFWAQAQHDSVPHASFVRLNYLPADSKRHS